jgi:quinol monooxygenase YgiN
MIVVQGWMRVHEGDRPAFRREARILVEETRKEPGNLAYAFAEDFNDPGLFHVVERWADEEAAAAHMTSPGIAAFLPKLAEMRDVHLWFARYDAPEERVLMQA